VEWLAENWFWVLVAVLFVVMHLFGHGGHGGHGGQGGPPDRTASKNLPGQSPERTDRHSEYRH